MAQKFRQKSMILRNGGKIEVKAAQNPAPGDPPIDEARQAMDGSGDGSAESVKTPVRTDDKPAPKPTPPEERDDDAEDGDIATPKRDRDDEQQGL
jgi:hypothetical protein